MEELSGAALKGIKYDTILIKLLKNQTHVHDHNECKSESWKILGRFLWGMSSSTQMT